MKKMDDGKLLRIVLWLLLCAVGAYILIKGMSLDKKTLVNMCRDAQEKAIEAYLPGILETEGVKTQTPVEWLCSKVEEQLPFLGTIQAKEMEETEKDQETDKKIMEENSDFLEAKLLEENQEAGPVGSGEENTGGVDAQSENRESAGNTEGGSQQEAGTGKDNTQTADAGDAGQQEASAANAIVNPISLDMFQDFDYVISNFYTIDKTTSINSDQLNAPALVSEDLKMTTGSVQPQILVYHSHSQEEFIDSNPGDPSTSIVGVGEYLVTLLRDTYGYNVLHVTDTFDIVDGKLDRNKAYNYAQDKISQVLEENPSVEVVIDLHRDGVPDDKHLVTDVNGKPTAKIMFFNGLSRTNQNGDIEYLPNPYIQDNLAFSLQLALQAKQYYPEWLRTIYLRGYRYNLHLRPKALLVECGAQTNTVEEEMNAMEPLADVLNKVLKGE